MRTKVSSFWYIIRNATKNLLTKTYSTKCLNKIYEVVKKNLYLFNTTLNVKI